MKKVDYNIVLEDVRVVFRNFKGEKDQYNPLGKRSFCVVLDPKDGKKYERDGWNIKWFEPREDGDERTPYLQVAVNFDGNTHPKIVLISSGGKTILDEDSVNMLDWAEIKSVDLSIRPYNWEVNGKKGVKAYLKTMYVTIYEDEFEGKYNDEDIPF